MGRYHNALRLGTPQNSGLRALTAQRGAALAIVATLTIAATGTGLHASAHTGQPAPKPVTAGAKQQAAEAYGKLPLSFEPNVGQAADGQVRFVTHSAGQSLSLTSSGATLALSPAAPRRPAAGRRAKSLVAAAPPATPDVLRIEVVGGSPAATVTGVGQLPGTANYFIGNDPTNWHTEVPTYSRVESREVLPGVDMAWYGNGGQLEYDLNLAAGVDPASVHLAYQGAKSLTLDPAGELLVHLRSGTLTQHAPVLYQQVTGARRAVDGRFVLLGSNEVGFVVGPHDPAVPLVIDPTLAYSTFLGGGSSVDAGHGIAVDSSGNAYVTGHTFSTDFPVCTGVGVPTGCAAAGFQATFGGSLGTAFVTKLNAAGTALVYSTYLGGSGGDRGFGIAVDSSGITPM
jgi:hypothetical protein